MAEHRRRVYWQASVLFFVSGATGLAYEVIWFKRFTHVWGSSTLAVAAVVASFLFGLGLGAQVFGRLADRARRPLWWYGCAEIAVGAIAVFIPFEIAGLRGLASQLYPVLQQHWWLQYGLRLALTLLIIGPPCILMGGTLPLLIRQFTARDSSLRESTGWFYAVNTVGAAAGCYLTGFHLLPLVGLYWANHLTALVNLAVGLAAMVLAKRLTAEAEVSMCSRDWIGEAALPSAVSVASAQARDPGSARIAALYAAAALAGLAALMLEIIWTRQLGLILGGSTYAFSAMLFIVLVGIGLGSLGFHLWLRDAPTLAQAPPLIVLALIGATTIGKWLIPSLTLLVSLVPPMRALAWFNAVTCVSVSAALQLVPALGMGLLFPLFVHLTRQGAEHAGRAVGSVYAWNTAGSLVGASITSALLIPHLGTAMTEGLALALYIAVLILLLSCGPSPARGWRFLCVAAACIAALLCVFEQDPRITNSGIGFTGYIPAEQLTARQVLYFREGASFNVLVTDQHGHRELHVNGKVDATNAADPTGNGDMSMQLGLAYLPRFLQPDAREVLVIGHGSGTTAGASLLFPETRVTCCEIEPAVLEAAEHFSDVNHRPEASPRFTVQFDDGRNHLQGTRAHYDLILSEPSNPWMAGVGNLFTREFYEAAESRLNEGGLLAQWIQVYNFTARDYTMLARTLMSVFPHYALVRISDGDTVLLASMQPLGVDRPTVDRAQALVDRSPEATADLKTYFGTSDVRSMLLRYLVLDEAGLRRLTRSDASRTVNTDLNLRIEFDAPLQLFDELDPNDTAALRIISAVDPRWFRHLFAAWSCSQEQVGALEELATLLAERGNAEAATEIARLGLTVDLDNPVLLATQLMLAPPAEPERYRSAVSRLAALSEEQTFRVGTALFQSGRYEQAAVVFEQLTERHPDSAAHWTNLGRTWLASGDRARAADALRKALALDPGSTAAKRAYAEFKSSADSKTNRRPVGNQSLSGNGVGR